ncbi:MAG: hypothetical protein WCV90_00385 [Candidatus Woesearchaeota archaeon]|jgi:hypothetical protein
MFVTHGGEGLYISLNNQDKQQVELEGRIEYTLVGDKNAKVILSVQEKVKPGPLCNSGFNIVSQPEFGGHEIKTQYDVYLSRKRWQELMTIDPETRAGHFTSRSIYDRIDINYFPI